MLTKEDVKKIAGLAKIKLNESDLEQYATQLGQILSFVEKLDKLDLKNVEPTSHAVSVTNVFREDVSVVSEVNKKIFEQAPSEEDHLFKVPRIIGS